MSYDFTMSHGGEYVSSASWTTDGSKYCTNNNGIGVYKVSGDDVWRLSQDFDIQMCTELEAKDRITRFMRSMNDAKGPLRIA
ncbi:MAG: hypothetical protein II795_00130 [Firmicutes bacterium]|nr:hypothetical protein [Bacillota bacterium]